MKHSIIFLIGFLLLMMLVSGCLEHQKKEVTSAVDLTVVGGAESAEQAMREYCQAMGQRDFEKASLYVWHEDWFDDPHNLEYERRVYAENLYKQGWRADDRDFSKFEIISKKPKGDDAVDLVVSIGSRKGYYTEYPYTVLKHQNRWYVQIESTTGTFGLNL